MKFFKLKDYRYKSSIKKAFNFTRLLIREAFSYDTENRERAASFTIFFVSGLTVVFLLWATFAQLDQVVSAEGKVIPLSKLQVIEHYEGGRVDKIHVQAGKLVKAGDLLVSLSPLQQRSEYNQLKDQVALLSMRVLRLTAEYEQTKLRFPDDLSGSFPAIAQSELALHRERVGKFQSMVAQKKNEVEIANTKVMNAESTLVASSEELSIVRQLVAKGLEAKISLTRAEKAHAEARANLYGARQDFERAKESSKSTRQETLSAVLEELTKAKSELHQAKEKIVVSADAADRTKIRSPIDGVVNRVLVTTEGGTVKPGERVVEIVPLEAAVTVEARVLPADIGFVLPNQKALVKFTAYDFSVFGSSSGTVSVVGADSVAEEKQDVYFPVKITLSSHTLQREGRTFTIIPGMVAQVDIITGQRSVLSYLFSPISKVLSTSFREK